MSEGSNLDEGDYYRGTSLRRPRTLRQAYAQGPMMVLGGGRFLVSEVPLYSASSGRRDLCTKRVPRGHTVYRSRTPYLITLYSLQDPISLNSMSVPCLPTRIEYFSSFLSPVGVTNLMKSSSFPLQS